MRRKRFIKDLNHRVHVCTSKDEFKDTDIIKSRSVAYSGWAEIVVKKASLYDKGGAAIKASRDQQTHKIYMHYRDDIDITAQAWLYEERRVSQNRWYKILGVEEEHDTDHWFCFSCRLVEKTDDLPVDVETSTETANNIAAELPTGANF